jgi:drug/metabolite transporter (DMT)-like permease
MGEIDRTGVTGTSGVRGPGRSGRAGRSGIAFALGAAAVSGGSVWLNGQVLARVPVLADPGTYTTAKNLVAGIVLASLALAASVRGSEAGLTRPSRAGQWWGLAAVAVVGGSVPFLLFFEGLAASGSPADAQLVHKAGLLVLVAVLARPVLRERLGSMQALGVAAVLLGYVMLSSDLDGIGAGRGLALVLAAAALWSVETVLDRRLLAGVNPATVAVARLVAGTMVLVAVGVVNGDTARLADLGASGWAWASLTGAVLALYTGLWLYALANARAVDVTAVLALAAPVTAVLALAVDGVALPDPAALAVLAAGALLVAAASGAGAGLRLATRAPG